MPERPRTVLGFDFGLRHVGVAVGQELTATATPLGTIPARDGRPAWAGIEALAREWRPDLLVVGLPLNMDGTESELCTRARAFARRLAGRLGRPAVMVDERLSTRAAWDQTTDAPQRRGRGADPAGRRRGGHRARAAGRSDHALAAVFILETWLAEPEAGVVP